MRIFRKAAEILGLPVYDRNAPRDALDLRPLSGADQPMLRTTQRALLQGVAPAALPATMSNPEYVRATLHGALARMVSVLDSPDYVCLGAVHSVADAQQFAQLARRGGGQLAYLQAGLVAEKIYIHDHLTASGLQRAGGEPTYLGVSLPASQFFLPQQESLESFVALQDKLKDEATQNNFAGILVMATLTYPMTLWTNKGFRNIDIAESSFYHTLFWPNRNYQPDPHSGLPYAADNEDMVAVAASWLATKMQRGEVVGLQAPTATPNAL